MRPPFLTFYHPKNFHPNLLHKICNSLGFINFLDVHCFYSIMGPFSFYNI